VRARRLTLAASSAAAGAAVQALTAIALVATLVAGLTALEAGRIDGALMVGLLLAVLASFETTALLVRSAGRLAGAAAAAGRLRAMVDTPPAITDPERPLALPEGGAVRLDNVDFAYPGAPPVLRGVCLDIAPGEIVALAGPSGSGKSSLARLLVRLADPLAGAVLVNGVDARDVALADLRRRVVLMTQDAPVFADSIAANLRIGRPGASEAQLWAALAAVGLDGLVRQLPGEAGRTVSVGEGRRLCLARTLLSEASVVVLDEPTSGLAPDAEATFLSGLRALAAGRTVIVVTHAALPPGAFDRVLELRAGKLAAA
jgi:ATP-binding cassette subfamily C protein CydC